MLNLNYKYIPYNLIHTYKFIPYKPKVKVKGLPYMYLVAKLYMASLLFDSTQKLHGTPLEYSVKNFILRFTLRECYELKLSLTTEEF